MGEGEVSIAQYKKDQKSQRIQRGISQMRRIKEHSEVMGKHIHTANLVESVNTGLERIRNDPGEYFPSMKSLDFHSAQQSERCMDEEADSCDKGESVQVETGNEDEVRKHLKRSGNTWLCS